MMGKSLHRQAYGQRRGRVSFVLCRSRYPEIENAHLVFA